MPIKPWWVITILSDKGHINSQSVGDQIDKQLLRWSLINGIMSSDDSPRWWAIDMLSLPIPADETELVQQVSQFLYNPLQRKNEEKPRIGGDIDATGLNIAVVGDVRNNATLAYLHSIGRMLRLNQSKLFPGMTLRILAFIYFPQYVYQPNEKEINEKIAKFFTELNMMMEHRIVAERPFDFIFIFQEKNNTIDNIEGYVSLLEEQVSELIVQSLFHLMIGESPKLDELKNLHRTHYFSMGAVAIYYDWQKHRRELAREIGEDLLDKFKSSNEEPFLSEEEARRALRDIEYETEIHRLFDRLTLGEDRPSFSFSSKIWEGARDNEGKLISPWELHKKALLYFYFLFYLRYLPLRLSEYARLFFTSSMQRFREFLRSRRHNVWEGGEEEIGLKGVLIRTVRDIMKGEFGRARSIEQVRNALERIREVCDSREVNSSLSAIEDFNRLEVFEVPDYLKEFYVQAPDYLSPEGEARLYDRLVGTIHVHPIPLALFLRSFLIAVLLAFLGDKLLNLLSPQFINLEWLLRVPGLTPIVLGIIPLAAAFWRYKVRTLNEIKKEIEIYVGALLKHVQSKAKELVRSELSALIDQVRSYCDEIEKYLDELKEKLNYPVTNESYFSTSFQRSILEEIDIPGQEKPLNILLQKPRYEIEISGQRKIFSQLDNQEKNSLLNRALNRQEGTSRRYLWELLCDSIPEVSEESVKNASELLREFAEEIYEEEYALHDLLLSQEKEHVGNVIEKMKSLCFPPVIFSQGVVSKEVSFEWKYGRCSSIGDIVDNHACSDIPGTSILSLSGYRPIGSLRDIATIQAIFTTVELGEIKWQDASAIFTMATLADEGDLVLKSAYDGVSIQITDEETKERVKKLRQFLKIEKGEGEAQLEI